MADVATGSQMRFFLSAHQLFGPLERGEGTGLVARFMKMYRRRLSLGQSQGYLFCRLIKPPQVHPRGAQIYAAEYPATLLESASALFRTDRLYHLIEPHSGVGNEKVGKNPLGVLPAESFCRATVANRDYDPHIFRIFWLAVTAGDITVNDQRMHLVA